MNGLKTIPFHVFQEHCCERRFKYLQIPNYYLVTCSLSNVDQCNPRICPVWNAAIPVYQQQTPPQPPIAAQQQPVAPAPHPAAQPAQPHHPAHHGSHGQPPHQHRQPRPPAHSQNRPAPAPAPVTPPPPQSPYPFFSARQHRPVDPAQIPVGPSAPPEPPPAAVTDPQPADAGAGNLREINLKLKENGLKHEPIERRNLGPRRKFGKRHEK